MRADLIFKVVPHREWERAGSEYRGSVHDRESGFLHFSTAVQLSETLRRHCAGQDGLVLLAVGKAGLGAALKWEYAPSRGEAFPHLYGAPCRKARCYGARRS